MNQWSSGCLVVAVHPFASQPRLTCTNTIYLSACQEMCQCNCSYHIATIEGSLSWGRSNRSLSCLEHETELSEHDSSHPVMRVHHSPIPLPNLLTFSKARAQIGSTELFISLNAAAEAGSFQPPFCKAPCSSLCSREPCAEGQARPAEASSAGPQQSSWARIC